MGHARPTATRRMVRPGRERDPRHPEPHRQLRLGVRVALHILAHEEMDMMHSLVFAVPPLAPTGLTATLGGTANNPRVNLSWTDNSVKEVQFTVQRRDERHLHAGTDGVQRRHPQRRRRKAAQWRSRTRPLRGRPTTGTGCWRTRRPGRRPDDGRFPHHDVRVRFLRSGFHLDRDRNAAASSDQPDGRPANRPKVSLTWRDNATNETGFEIERSTTTCGTFAPLATAGRETARATSPSRMHGRVRQQLLLPGEGVQLARRVGLGHDAQPSGGGGDRRRADQPHRHGRQGERKYYTADAELGGRHQPIQLHDPAPPTPTTPRSRPA